ncbi:unnamed protein product [marine sediment metagenome]|uniref:Uncharacterized protein n=1 Tax=marine sediment metagenome TaxID=412755 RepID=X1QRP4_9ZZZZ
MNNLEMAPAPALASPVREQNPEFRVDPTTNPDPMCDLNDLLDFHWRRLP